MQEKERPVDKGQKARKGQEELRATLSSIGDGGIVTDAVDQARLNAILEQTSDLIATATPDAKLTYLNLAGRAMVGWGREESLDDRVIADLHPLKILKKIETEGLPAAAATGVWEGETVLLHRNGREIPVSQVILAHRSPDGVLQYFSSIMRNITERKRSELELRESEDKYRRLIETTGTGYVILDDHGQIIDANQEYAYLTGRQKLEEVIGQNVLEWTAPHDLERNASEVRQCIDQGFVRNLEIDYVTPSGQFIPVEINATVLRSSGILRILSLCRDITERKHAEEESKAHIRFLECLERVDQVIKQETDVEQMLWNITQTVFSLFDCDRAWLLYPCDPEAPSFRVPIEITRSEYPGAKLFDIDVPMTPGEAQNMREALGSDEPVTYTVGTEKPISTAKQFGVQSQMFVPLYPKLGKPWVFGMHQCSYPRIWTKDEKKLFNEISRRISDGLSSVLFLRELQENEERFRATFEQAAVGIAHVAPDGRWLRVNQKLCNIVGYSREELLQMTFQDITYPEDLDANLEYIRQVLTEENSTDSMEKRYFRKDGSLAWINMTVSVVRNASGDPAYFISVIEDIAKRKNAEEEKEKLQGQLLQAQKMESVGRLAGGVAHDFNNMLGIIIGHAEMALDRVETHHPVHADLEVIWKAAERSADLTRQLLAFARKQTVTPRVLDLNETVDKMLKMLQRLVGEDIELIWMPGSDLWQVKIDPIQIDQILMNHAANARDAIAGVGKVSIETRNVIADVAYCTGRLGIVPGEYVMLAVSDNGCGMDRETLANIFEPFFTTKELGKGTGLGLAMVYGIVKQNKGAIYAYSEPGEGTIFRIYLPRYVNKISSDYSALAPTESTMGGPEIVLLVEDESMLLEMFQAMLEKLEYTVLVAGTPGEAIRLAEEHAGEIHLLMTDVVMPEMNGRDLAKRLLSLYPNIKRLFMSGYTADVIAHHGVLDEGMHFIQKPFTLKELALKVRKALD